MPINAFMTDDGYKNKKSANPAASGVDKSLLQKPDAGLQPVTAPVTTQGATGYGYGQSKATAPAATSNVDTLRAAYEASKTPAATSPATTPATAVPAATVPAAETLEAVPAAAEGLSPYEARELASYRAQEDAVNRLYEARQRAQIQALRDAYDQNMLTYQAAREDIAPVFEAQRNATAAESEKQRAAFNEYAAARGLNSGAGGQAELARGNVLAGNLNALNTEQARQETEIDRSIAALKAQYQNQIAQAKADNDYQRLADLLTEYRTQEQSLVNTSANQADEDYKAWAAQYNAYRDSVGDKQYAEQFNYQKERDAVSDNQWERQFALSKARSSGSSGGSYSGASGGYTAKPTLTAAQAKAAYDSGYRTDQVLAAMDYYYGGTLEDSDDEAGTQTGQAAAQNEAEYRGALGGSGIFNEAYWRGVKNGAGNGNTGGARYAKDFDSYDDYRALYNDDVARIYSADGPQVLSRNQWQRLKNTRQPGDGWETNYNSYEEYVRAFNEGYLKAYGG